jgi:hypothetical protein
LDAKAQDRAMTDLGWMEKKRQSEYEPHEESGYNHPEEDFFPEVSYPPLAKEEDLAFPSTRENETVKKEIDRREQINRIMAQLNPTTWLGGRNGL